MMENDDLPLLLDLADAALQAGMHAIEDAALLQQAGGNVARAFDKAARAAVLELLRQRGHATLLLAEDEPPKRFGRGAPSARIIIRPVEGMPNFNRGLPFSSCANFCIASTPPAGPLEPATVRSVLIKPLAEPSGLYLLANGQALEQWEDTQKPLRTSNVEYLPEAFVSVALDGHAPGKAMAELLAQAAGVRALGSCSAALLSIARGQVDVHIDIRGNLTVENWLAGAALVRAAGGVVMLLDDALEQAAAPTNPQQCRGLIAASNRPLLDEILARLRRAFLP